MKCLPLVVAVALAGCAAKPGIATAPDGTLTVLRRGTELGSTTGPLRQQALKEAEDYCVSKGLRMKVIWSREVPAIGHWPEAQVWFKCE